MPAPNRAQWCQPQPPGQRPRRSLRHHSNAYANTIADGRPARDKPGRLCTDGLDIHRGYTEARPTRKSFTSSLTPLRRRAPAGDHSKPGALPAASRVESATMTVPGRASAVTRLATFTGLPNQSPARLTASPDATPIRRGAGRFRLRRRSGPGRRAADVPPAPPLPLRSNHTSGIPVSNFSCSVPSRKPQTGTTKYDLGARGGCNTSG